MAEEEIEHIDAPEGQNHIPHQYKVADQTALDALIATAKDINKLILKEDDGVYYRITGYNPFTYQQNTVEDFPNAVGAQTVLTGIKDLNKIVFINADTTKINIESFEYWIQGIKYSYPGSTAISPTIAAGDSSTFIGVDTAGIVYSPDKFTDEETKTILPLARLQAEQGQSGPGSNLQSPIHENFPIGQEGYSERAWIANAIGVLYSDDGFFEENSTTPLQVDGHSGSFYDAQRKYTPIAAEANIEASSLYNVSGVPTLQTRATVIIPKFYDDGTDIVALDTTKYVSHTLLRSPKEENLFFFIYWNQEFDSQAEAERANPDYSIFQNQATSGLYAAARFIIKGDSTNIEAIQDERPQHILEDLSTGKGIQAPSYAGMYISSSAPTTISTIDVFVKAAGTTTEVTSSADFTVSSSNRFTYTGAATRRFKVDLVSSITSVSNNQKIRLRYAIDGTTQASSEIAKLGTGTIVGTIPLTDMVELSQGQYIELWVANNTSTSDLTVDTMNINLVSID